jgi:TRAP transporter TAXI family solute receptor
MTILIWSFRQTEEPENKQTDELQNMNLTVAGASPGGLWSALGVGLDKVMSTAYPGMTVTYQTSSGGLANVKLVADGKVPLGIVSDMGLKAAWGGTGVYEGRPQKNIRLLFRLYNAESRFQAIHLLINRDYAENNNISSFSDIVTNKLDIRIAINRPGNMDGDLGIAVLEELGAPVDEINNWGGQVIRAATREQTNLMTDRRIDIVNFGIAYNHSTVREMSNAVRLMMVDLTEPVTERVINKLGGKSCIFKKDEYTFLDGDIVTICAGAVIIANESMPDETAYSLTKAMIENLDEFSSAHTQLAKVTSLNSIAEGTFISRHPGAERALKEAGLIQ